MQTVCLKERIERQMGSRITATGAGLPEKHVKNDELSAFLEGVNDEWVFKRTGIHERRIVTDENTSDLAAKAARQALERSGTDAKDIDPWETPGSVWED